MASGQFTHDPVMLGALLGWKRIPIGTGAVVRVQVTRSLRRDHEDFVDEYDVALTANQLRILGEDLIRAADEHEGRVPVAKRRWWLS